MGKVRSEKNPDIEWKYYFENMSKEDTIVAVMYYKGIRALNVKENQMQHYALLEPYYRFIYSFNVSYEQEAQMCEKTSNDNDENLRNQLVVGCKLIEENFLKQIATIKSLI